MSDLVQYRDLSYLAIKERYTLPFEDVLYDALKVEGFGATEGLGIAPLYRYYRVNTVPDTEGLATVGRLARDQSALLLLNANKQYDPEDTGWRFDLASARYWRSGTFIRLGIIVPELPA